MSILHLHPDRWLAAYCEGALPPARQARVAAHLERCARCRARAADVRRGLGLARQLGPVSPPAAVDAAVAAALRRAPAASAPRLRLPATRWRWAAAPAGGALAALLLLLSLSTARVELEPAPAGLGSLEELGLQAHSRLARGALPLDLESRSPAEIRNWLGARGLSAALVVDRPAADGDRFQPLGAAELRRGDRPAAAVVYAVDGQPVVLVTARQRDVPDAPRWSLLGKQVHYRETAGPRVLTWSNSGKAYALVSGLPRLGLDGCLLCHADARRRELVRSLAAPHT